MVELFIILAVISIALFAITSILSKYIIPMIGGPYRFLTIQLSIAFPILILITIYELLAGFEYYLLFEWNILVLISLNAFFTFLGYISLLVGLDKGNVSVGGIILSSRVFASIPLGFFIIGEQYPIYTYFFIIISLVGAILVSWENNMEIGVMIRLQAPGIRYFIATAFFWGFANVLIRELGGIIPPFVFLTIRQLIMLIIALAFYKIGIKVFDNEKSTLNRKILGNILLYVIILLIAQGFFVYGLGKSLTITEGIGVAEGAFTLLFSLIIAKFIDNSILKEPLDQKSLLTKVLGMIIASIGTLGIIW